LKLMKMITIVLIMLVMMQIEKIVVYVRVGIIFFPSNFLNNLKILLKALKVENLLNNDNYYTQQQLNNNYNNLYEPLGVNKLTQHQHRTQQPSRTNNQSTTVYNNI
jgi:hypothetical protein